MADDIKKIENVEIKEATNTESKSIKFSQDDMEKLKKAYQLLQEVYDRHWDPSIWHTDENGMLVSDSEEWVTFAKNKRKDLLFVIRSVETFIKQYYIEGAIPKQRFTNRYRNKK